MRGHNWRDCKAWAEEGLALSTTSNEAAKLFDACLTQLVGWYDDTSVGGLAQSMGSMSKADPDFILGRVFNFGMQLIGTLESIHTNKDLLTEYHNLEVILESKKTSLTKREILHTQAILLWACGKMSLASGLWEEILLDYPTDLFALKMANITYFYLGDSKQLRDSPARVLPIWETKRPLLKNFIYGMYSFGLEETNEFQKAELYARKGLEEDSRDGWSTHSLAHIFEMEGRTKEGLDFMNSTVKNWEQSNHLAGHNNWHVALFHLENEDYQSAVEILENRILTKATISKQMLDIVDTSSLLYRLLILNPSSLKESHWDQLLDICKSYSKHHISTFNDVHLMMAYSGCGRLDLVEDLIESVSNSKGDMADHQDLTKGLLQSIADFRDERYSKVVEALEPIRCHLQAIGGSHAQRDVFNLMLIIAALKSTNTRHHKLARVLINEREAFKQTPLTQKFDILKKGTLI